MSSLPQNRLLTYALTPSVQYVLGIFENLTLSTG